ncbi:pentatricopeptide repeat-containing protein At2g13600-like [Phalaenopsis equestris]|uniref:pentatricopeptide repeat-containing protein At2g13600-like n=1 Tax=Phalaenopsis equestris TaxID=78828 RepID=UPI0009E43307|nr:pentatricopeptide repeat-containing protein At2g13600-like [Phalaenopsis equestris]
MSAKSRLIFGRIYHSAISFSTESQSIPNSELSSSSSIAAIFKSFKKKLAVGSLSFTPSSFKSYVETCASLLRRCSCTHRLLAGLALHGHAVRCGISADRSVFTKLLTMYSECNRTADRNLIFIEFAGSDIFSWNFIINDFARSGDIDSASKLFDEMPERNVVSWTIIIDELMKRGRVHDAMGHFERCPYHTVVSYTATINGLARNGMYFDGLVMFRQMIRCGLMPNDVTFTCLISACGVSGEFDLAKSIVGMIVKNKFDQNLSVCNSLITLYLRMGDVEMARRVFDGMVERDVVSWTALLDVCFQMGDLKEACHVFDEMPDKNEVTWSMMIARYSQSGEALEASRLFNQMLCNGFTPNVSSFASVISASAILENLLLGRSVHSHVVKFGYENDVFVASSLIDMYSKCGKSEDARRLFDSLSVKNIVCWNAMVGGYFYDRRILEAKHLFNEISERNAASWNAMISGFVQNELYEDALETFNEMLSSGQEPNRMTFSSVLLACANLPSLEKGKTIHGRTIKLGVGTEIIVGTALIDMYAKSGDIESSKSVFSLMPKKNEVSWTAMIQGLADSGLAYESLALFEELKKTDISPSEPMFLSILFACSHCRLVDKGFHYFESMDKAYGITPTEKHYTAMVDLLSRAGLLREAEEFIRKMPIKPEANTWAALLSGCVTHGNDGIGERAAKMVIDIERQRTAGYVLLSNIYASVERWKDVAKIRMLMRATGVKKGGGCSWIQIREGFHAFYCWDFSHPNALEIYEVLELLIPEMVPFLL